MVTSVHRVAAVVAAWTIVGVPLLYGVVMTLVEASQLLTD